MFKPGSGRKLESEVWKYFVYDSASDKSRCLVKLTEATSTTGSTDSTSTAESDCGQLLIGKTSFDSIGH